jgi:hypothetical protein
VRYWRKQKEALRNTKSDSRALRGPKAGKYPSLENELLNYFEELIDYWIDNGIYSAYIMIIINLIIDKSRLLQNYNNILTKHTILSIILE